MAGYQLTPEDRLSIDEFRQRPMGPHSPNLQRILNRMRGGPKTRRPLLACSGPTDNLPTRQERQSLPVLPNLPSTRIIASFRNLSTEVRQTHITQIVLLIGFVETGLFGQN